MPNTIDQNAEIEKDLAELSLTPIQRLRLRWRIVFRTEPPAAFGPDLLRSSIAQRIQKQHYGGLSASAQKELNQIIKAMASEPSGRIELPRRIKPGAVLVRMWKDKSHRVTVVCTENLNPHVMVMESAEDWVRFDISSPLNRTRGRRIFVQ